MHVTVHRGPDTATADVYDRLMSAHAQACTNTDTQLCKGLKMEPEPQNTILSEPPHPLHPYP